MVRARPFPSADRQGLDHPTRRTFLRSACAAGAAAVVAGPLYSAARTANAGPPAESSIPVPGLSIPEDLAAIPGTDWIITSAFPSPPTAKATTFFVNTRSHEVRAAFPDNCTFDFDRHRFGEMAPPEVTTFHGLDVGKTSDGRIVLYQINCTAPVSPGKLIGRDAIEVFDIDTAVSHAPSLRWRGAIALPSWAPGNDCAALPEGGVAVTNTAFGGMVPGLSMLLSGKSSGDVLEWHDREGGWSVIEGTDVSSPNGIAVSADGRYLYVVSSTTKQLHRISRSEPHRDRTTTDLGMVGDNVTWTSDGHLLVVGAMGEIGDIFKAAFAGKLGGPFRIVKVDPASMAVETVLEAKTDGCIPSTALQVSHHEIWVGALGLKDKLLTYQI
jgi:DNA-binding beta-propeller fold protein YncE